MNKKKLYREIKSFEPTHLNEKYKKLSFTIVLVQPETYGNIGSIARVMKNFNFQHLVIFNPIEDLLVLLSVAMAISILLASLIVIGHKEEV